VRILPASGAEKRDTSVAIVLLLHLVRPLRALAIAAANLDISLATAQPTREVNKPREVNRVVMAEVKVAESATSVVVPAILLATVCAPKVTTMEVAITTAVDINKEVPEEVVAVLNASRVVDLDT